MKRKKIITLIFTLFIFCAAVALIGTHFKRDKSYHYIDLKRIAKTEGFVRVIVKIDVPDIHHLTAESNRYKTGNKNAAYVQEASEADVNLERAISYAADRVLHKLDGKAYEINHTFFTLPYLALDLSPEALTVLRNLPEVLTIVEDRLTPLPETGRYTLKEDNISQPLLYDSAGIIGAEEAWSMGFTGDGWHVAILDSGLFTNHEFFNGKHIVEQCYSLLHDCPNGQNSMSGTGAAAHILENEFHGTHVTGIAVGNSGNNIFGVAKGADIIAVQVFSYIAAWDDIGSYDSDQIKGLEFVYKKRNQYKIAAVNMSLGAGEYTSPCDSSFNLEKAAIDNLKAVRIPTVIASGNNGFCGAIDAPACISSAVAVSGTTKSDNHWDWANWHKSMVDLMAPAANIYSSSSFSNSSYTPLSGTSMATPHVSGAYAVLRQADPSLSFDKALTVLKDEGKLITSQCSSTPKTPRVDIGAAVKSLISLAPPLNFAGEQKKNRSLLQTEYLNVLTWQENPLNDENNQIIVNYKIYTVDSSNELTLLVQVDANTFEYWHRAIQIVTDYRYAVKAINDKGEDSAPVFTTVAAL